MKKRFLLKLFTIIVLFCIVILNTTYAYGASRISILNRDNVELSETRTGRSILRNVDTITNYILNKYSTKVSLRDRILNRNIEVKISDPKAALKETFELMAKIPVIGNFFEIADLDADRLATVVSNIRTDIDWSNKDTYKILVKRLSIAIIKTTDMTNGLVTKDDLNKMIEDMTNGKYYYPDATDEVTYTNIQDVARLSNYGLISPEAEGKPISIGKVYLHGKDFDATYGAKGKEIYMVTLNGTGFVEGQQYGMIADLLSGMETDSQYLHYALKAITENVPKGSSLLLAGMSLGGMMAQQVMVQDCILANYKVEYVTIIGSPALCVEERVVQFEKYGQNPVINRIIDQHDLVPYACVDYLTGADYFENNTSIPKEGVVQENLYVNNANYHHKTGIGHHFVGYLADEVWRLYDPLGFEGLGNTISLKHSDFTYYDAPSYTNGKISIIE